MIISLAIQKGGSGKTTTAINLAAALKELGHSVLLIDLDPQSNLTQALGINEDHKESVYELLHGLSAGSEVDANDVILQNNGLPMIPASLELANAELELVSTYGREQMLRQALEPIRNNYDFIFIDCPPAIGMLTVNALAASDYVLIPLQAEFLPLKGVESFIQFYEKMRKQVNKHLQVLGFLLTKYDHRKQMNRNVLEQLYARYGSQVFETRIRTNISLAKAQEKGVPIFQHDMTANGALDYMQLAQEFLRKTSDS